MAHAPIPEAAFHPIGLASAFAGSQPQQVFPFPGPPTLWRGYKASLLEKACSPENLEQARPGCAKSASISGWSCQFWLTWGRAPWVLSGPANCSHPQGVGCCTPVEQLPSTASSLQEPPQPRNLEQAQHGRANLPPLWCGPSNSGHPGEEPLGFSVAQLASSNLGWWCTPVELLPSTTSPLEEPHIPETPEEALPGYVKSASIAVRTSQSCLHSGSPSLLQRDPVSPVHPLEKPHCLTEDQPTTPVLG